MKTRTITYTNRTPSEPEVAEHFRIAEATSDDGLHHALAVPKRWISADVPVDPDPDAPTLGALHVESSEPGPQHGILVAGHLARDRFDDATAAAEWLAQKDGFSVQQWKDVGDDGAIALARTESHLMSLRVLPHGPAWAFASAVIPASRQDTIGAVLRSTVESFRLPPEWTSEPE